MRAEGALAVLLLAGCRDDAPAPAPDPTVVAVLAAVQFAEAHATLAGASGDSARAVTLAAHGIAAAEFDRWLDRASEDPDAAAALWDAVARRLDAERLAGAR